MDGFPWAHARALAAGFHFHCLGGDSPRLASSEVRSSNWQHRPARLESFHRVQAPPGQRHACGVTHLQPMPDALDSFSVHCCQWKFERFRDRDIPCVVARYGMPKFPYALGEWVERKQLQIELRQIVMSCIRFGCADALRPFQPSQCVGGFGPNQLRRVKRAACQNTFCSHPLIGRHRAVLR